MRNFLFALATLGLSASSAYATGVDVQFEGACENGSFSEQNLDIEYSDLDLDLFEDGKNECVITTTVPGRPGYLIEASAFAVQGEAFDVNRLASLYVSHRFNGQIVRGVRSVARTDGPLEVFQTAFAFARCGEDAVLRSKLSVTASDAMVIIDQAQSVTYEYRYILCP